MEGNLDIFHKHFLLLIHIFIKIMSIINFNKLVTSRNARKAKKQVVSTQY